MKFILYSKQARSTAVLSFQQLRVQILLFSVLEATECGCGIAKLSSNHSISAFSLAISSWICARNSKKRSKSRNRSELEALMIIWWRLRAVFFPLVGRQAFDVYSKSLSLRRQRFPRRACIFQPLENFFPAHEAHFFGEKISALLHFVSWGRKEFHFQPQ